MGPERWFGVGKDAGCEWGAAGCDVSKLGRWSGAVPGVQGKLRSGSARGPRRGGLSPERWFRVQCGVGCEWGAAGSAAFSIRKVA